jgi:hypothetical protein
VLQVSGASAGSCTSRSCGCRCRASRRPGPTSSPTAPSPLLDVELEAGDALYLPRGYVHAALTTDEHSVHLTVGVLSTTWYDVLTDVVSLAGPRGSRSATRCPVQPADGLAESLPDLLRRAATWLEQAAPRAGRGRRAPAARPCGARRAPAAARHRGGAARARQSTPLRPRSGLAAVCASTGESLVLTCPARR